MSLFDLLPLQNLVPALQQGLEKSVAASINTAIAMDPASERKIKPLEACILAVEISNMNQRWVMAVRDAKVVLLNNHETASVTLRGSAAAFAKLAASQNKNIAFQDRSIEMTGDAVRAQQIQSFAKSLKIDWEALLAEIIGDTPATLLSSGLKQGWSMAQILTKNFVSDLEEFVKYEARLLPNKARAQAQFDTIDALRLQTDRLQARVQKLRPKVNSDQSSEKPSEETINTKRSQ